MDFDYTHTFLLITENEFKNFFLVRGCSLGNINFMTQILYFFYKGIRQQPVHKFDYAFDDQLEKSCNEIISQSQETRFFFTFIKQKVRLSFFKTIDCMLLKVASFKHFSSW